MRSLLSFLHYYCFRILFNVAGVICLCGIFSGGCTAPTLSTFSEYISSEYFAASKIGLEGVDVGESFGKQLVMTWSLPKRYRKGLPLRLCLHIYYGCDQYECLTYEINNELSGYRVFSLRDEEYDRRREIVSYKVVLMMGEEEIVTSRHHLWTEIIPISKDDESH